MKRFRHLKANTGWGGVIRTTLMVVLCVGVAFYITDPAYIKLVILGALLSPALLSKSFANSPGPWSSVVKKSAWVMFAVAFVGPQLRDNVEVTPEIVAVLWGTLALYIGLFFWFWSNPEVVRLGEE